MCLLLNIIISKSAVDYTHNAEHGATLDKIYLNFSMKMRRDGLVT
jgi:hypothetical protein